MGLCCVWLRCVWSSGTHSQTRRTGSPHTQSLQSVSTTTPTQWVCVVCGPVVHTAKPGELDHHTRNRYRVWVPLHLRNGVCVVCDWGVCGPVVHTAKPGELDHRTRNRYRVWVPLYTYAMGLCCVWLRCVWSSGTHSQTRRTGSPHTQSLQSVSTTLHLRNGVCVVCDWGVCGPVVHTAKPGELGHRIRNRYRV